jgi:putative membrane protein
MDMMGGGMMGVWFLMMLFGLLAFIGIILLAVWAVTRLSGNERMRAGGASASASAEDPLVILQRRYARGEIGRDDYERIRADLKGSG